MLAVGIYSLALAVLLQGPQRFESNQEDLSRLESEAATALDLIVETAGIGAAGTAWASDPDNLKRFGLLADDGSGLLSLEKMRNLTRGNLTAGANGLPDYAEIRSALGLDGKDFHLRSRPLLPALGAGDFEPLSGLKLAYVGDFSDTDGSGQAVSRLVQFGTSGLDNGTFIQVNVSITNNGTASTVFQVSFEASLDDGIAVETQNSPLLEPGASCVLTTRYYKTSGWDWDDDANMNVSIQVSDPRGTVGSAKVSLAGYAMATGGNGIAQLWIDAERLYLTSGENARFPFGAYDGEGDNANGVSVTIELRNASSNALLQSWSETTSNNGKVQYNSIQAGTYVLGIRKSDGSIVNNDTIHVTQGTVGDFAPGGAITLREGRSSIVERAVLSALLPDFVNRTYNESGDVYPDVKRVLNNDFATNITGYRVVIVGSEVDHNSMTSAGAKLAVRDWVLAGGVLIVFGSSSQQVGWLQPLFHASLATAGSGISVPDPTHPILHTPEELQYLNWIDNGYTWQLNSQSSEDFTHVITRTSGGGSGSNDLLAVSKPGHFGSGEIVLTAFTPYNLTAGEASLEPKKMFYNFLLQAMNPLYVDLGPMIPLDQQVATATRIALAPNPLPIGASHVSVQFTLYVW